MWGQKRYEKRELLNAPPRETIITAIASEPESKMASTASEYNEKLARRYSISHAASIDTITAIQSGLNPATKPTATPTKAECASVSLIIE